MINGFRKSDAFLSCIHSYFHSFHLVLGRCNLNTVSYYVWQKSDTFAVVDVDCYSPVNLTWDMCQPAALTLLGHLSYDLISYQLASSA